MAEEQTEQAEAPKKSKLPILIAAIAVVAAVGVTGYFLLFARKAEGGEKEKAKAAEAEHEKEAGPKIGPLLDLNSFIVNLDVGEARYLKVGMSIEVENEEKKKEFDQVKAIVRNEVLMSLSGFDIDKARTAKGKRALEKRILQSINKRLGQQLVRGVYFTEFVTQ